MLREEKRREKALRLASVRVLGSNRFYNLQVDEDQTDWVEGPYDDDVDHDEEGAYGVEAMCRLITALHAKATMPTALSMIPQVSAGFIMFLYIYIINIYIYSGREWDGTGTCLAKFQRKTGFFSVRFSVKVMQLIKKMFFRKVFFRVCMYVCMVITYSRVWINRVRLPILLVISRTGKMDIRTTK